MHSDGETSLSVEKATECCIFECSCSNMIVACADKKKRGKGGKTNNASPCVAQHVQYTLVQYAQTHTHTL